MNDIELIDYCERHCEKVASRFSGRQVNRMLALAGHPDGYPESVPAETTVFMKEDMKTLVQLARARQTHQKSGATIVPFAAAS